MQLCVRSEDGPVLHVGLSGRVSMAVLTEQQEALSELLGSDGYNRSVLMDMSEAEAIDSAGMSWLVVQHKRFCDAGGKLAIHSVPFTIFDTLKVMRLDQVLNVAENASQALKMVGGESE